MSVKYLRKVQCIGRHFSSSSYSYDPKRKLYIEEYFNRGVAKGLDGDDLVRFVRKKLSTFFGMFDHIINQIEETVRRKLRRKKKREPAPYDELFDWAFHQCARADLKGRARVDYITEVLVENFGPGNYEGYIEQSVKRKLDNFRARKKLFYQKFFLNTWTHFGTVTYSDENFSDENSFRESVKRTFNNFATRRGWDCMFVFERGRKGEDNEGRLHVHGLFNVPEGQMPGRIEKIYRYSFKKKCMTECHENSFFLSAYGINDFKPLAGLDLSWDNVKNETVNYILKYMFKDDEKIVYSRGTASAVYSELSDDDAVLPMGFDAKGFVYKWLLYDDVISFDKSSTRINDDINSEVYRC